MKCLILHISDIHFKETDTLVLDRAKSIASTVYGKLPMTDHVFITVTGDIAYSGITKEYEIAKIFLTNIKRYIIAENNIPVSFIMVPGNHDCDFSKPTTIRDVIIKDIIQNGENTIDNEKISECVKVQKNFEKFRVDLASENEIYNDSLWRMQEFGAN